MLRVSMQIKGLLNLAVNGTLSTELPAGPQGSDSSGGFLGV